MFSPAPGLGAPELFAGSLKQFRPVVKSARVRGWRNTCFGQRRLLPFSHFRHIKISDQFLEQLMPV
jgi:hypothetical protein